MGLISGAVWEYNAKLGITGTTTITAWADQSGNSRDLNNHVGTPDAVARTLNGFPTVDFTGADELLYRLSVAITLPRTFYAVVQSDVSNSPAAELKFINHGTGGVGIIDTTWCADAGSTNLKGGTVDLLPHIVVFVDNGASSRIEVDGVQVVTGGDAGGGTTVDVEIGGDGGSQGWNGAISFAACVNTADNTTLTRTTNYNILRNAFFVAGDYQLPGRFDNRWL